MKIWKVGFSTEDGEVGTLTTEAHNYQRAIEKTRPQVVKEFGITTKELRTLYVSKVEMVLETDVE